MPPHHIGYANITGRADQALAHLRAVTGMSQDEVAHHIDQANSTWIARSALTWTLHLSMLTDTGITLRRPERAEDRPAAANRALEQARRGDVPVQRAEPEPPRIQPRLPDAARAPRRGWLRRLAGG